MEVLVTARQEYQKQLCNVMTPHMVVAFQELYEEAERLSKNKNTLKQFQALLKDVKHWNSNIVKQHVDSVSNACSWYNDLLAAVFVSAVKILSSVRLSTERKKLNIKIPSNETFVQGCYENAARELYRDPYIYGETMNEYDRDDILVKRMSACINLTVDNMIPVQEILRANMGNRNPGDVDIETGPPESDDEDPDVESEGEQEDVPVTVPEPMQPPEPVAMSDGVADNIPEEVKDINFDKVQPPAGGIEEDDDVLFPGAPER
jgi:hypothetical protein